MKLYQYILASGLLLLGCESIDEKFSIKQINKLHVNAGEDITLSIGKSTKITGYAEDYDGKIVQYKWKENDTELSNEAELIIDSMSEGKHTLIFSVEDNDGNRNSDEIIVSIKSEEEILIETYLDAVNEARSKSRDCRNGRGLLTPTTPLKWDDGIYHAALEHSRDMALSNTYEHEGSGTKSDSTGFRNNSKSNYKTRIAINSEKEWEYTSENIIAGAGTLDKMMKEWLKSPPHCANIMNSNWTHFGMAKYRDDSSKWGIYWTQNFAKKAK